MNSWNPVERFVNERYSNAVMGKLQLSEKDSYSIGDWLKSNKRFFVYAGIPGCGKTFCSVACSRYKFDQEKKKNPYPGVFFYPIRNVFEELKEQYQNRQSDASVRERIKSCDFLALDDIGASRMNEWQTEIILDIVDARYSNLKPTIFTTNLRPEEFKEHFGERSTSRLLDKENLILEEWEIDHRIKQNT